MIREMVSLLTLAPSNCAAISPVVNPPVRADLLHLPTTAASHSGRER